MQVHQNNKSISLLERQKLIKAGDKERYALAKLIEEMNCNDKYIYQLLTSESYVPVGYDGFIIIRDRLTDKVLDMLLVETKVREKHWDELIFERKKLNTLKRERDQLVKEMLPSMKPTIVYISFTPKGTYLFNIDQLIEENKLPKLTSMSMNAMTVADNVKKVNKQVYLLSNELATYKKYKFDILKYANEQIENSLEVIKSANKDIQTYYSIF